MEIADTLSPRIQTSEEFPAKEGILDALNWRYATKQFDKAKKVPERELRELLEAPRLAPSSFGLQPWKFLVITDPDLRARLRAHSWDQPQITDASHLIVLLARKTIDNDYIRKYVGHTAKIRKVPIESLESYSKMLQGFSEGMSPEVTVAWTKKQAYIALGFLLFAAAEKHIDACPMEGFDAVKFDKELGLKDYTTAVLCPIGYRSPDDKYADQQKVRFGHQEVIERR